MEKRELEIVGAEPPARRSDDRPARRATPRGLNHAAPAEDTNEHITWSVTGLRLSLATQLAHAAGEPITPAQAWLLQDAQLRAHDRQAQALHAEFRAARDAGASQAQLQPILKDHAAAIARCAGRFGEIARDPAMAARVARTLRAPAPEEMAEAGRLRDLLSRLDKVEQAGIESIPTHYGEKLESALDRALATARASAPARGYGPDGRPAGHKASR